jgi:hypothetical protein
MQQVLPMWEMTPEVSLIGTQMLEESVSIVEIALRLSWTVSLDLKNYRVNPMCPERGYISLVSDTLLLPSLLPWFPVHPCFYLH